MPRPIRAAVPSLSLESLGLRARAPRRLRRRTVSDRASESYRRRWASFRASVWFCVTLRLARRGNGLQRLARAKR